MYLVFVKVLNVNYGVPNSGSFLLLGLVLWSFFAELTGGSVGSIVGKGDLLRKLNFPRYVVVLSTSFSALINLFLSMIVVIIFLVIEGHAEVTWRLLLVPVLIAELFVFGVALGFFLSATYVKLRDMGYVWDVVLQVLFYATPIFFPIGIAPMWAQKIMILNPLAQIIQDSRYALVSSKTVTIANIYGTRWIRVVPILITLLIVIIAGLYFRKQSRFFAEEI